MRRRGVSAERVSGIAARVRPVSVALARRLDRRMEWLAASRASLSVIAILLILTGGSLVILGAIPVAVPLMGLPIAVFAVGLMARDGAVVAAGYALLAGAVVAVVAMR
jgi:hypothetical protein